MLPYFALHCDGCGRVLETCAIRPARTWPVCNTCLHVFCGECAESHDSRLCRARRTKMETSDAD
jgi:hypothetical protein